MIVPEGARPGQILRCMLVPNGAAGGMEVLVLTPDGEMAVTIPLGMEPGEVLVVDMGDNLRQWPGAEEPGCCSRFLTCASESMAGMLRPCLCIAFVVCFFLLITTMLR